MVQFIKKQNQKYVLNETLINSENLKVAIYSLYTEGITPHTITTGFNSEDIFVLFGRNDTIPYMILSFSEFATIENLDDYRCLKITEDTVDDMIELVESQGTSGTSFWNSTEDQQTFYNFMNDVKDLIN